MGSYEFLEHTADVKLRAEGNSFADALEASLNGLASLLRGNSKPPEGDEMEIEKSSAYLEDLVVESLEALLVMCELEKFLPSRVKVVEYSDFGEEKLVRFVVLGAKAEEIETPVKAVTYHQLKVEESNGKWLIEVVLDI